MSKQTPGHHSLTKLTRKLDPHKGLEHVFSGVTLALSSQAWSSFGKASWPSPQGGWWCCCPWWAATAGPSMPLASAWQERGQCWWPLLATSGMTPASTLRHHLPRWVFQKGWKASGEGARWASWGAFPSRPGFGGVRAFRSQSWAGEGLEPPTA